MKYFALFIITFVSTSAFAKTNIYVSCNCSYYVDYLIQFTEVTGVRENATLQDIESCKIEKGRVIEGCYPAIMNAQWNCQQISKKMNYSNEAGSGMVEQTTCYGTKEESN